MARKANNSTRSVCIIGAGVIGCAVAYELSRSGYSVVVLDINRRAGQGITSRNSEVIHAGMYYPTGSLKARTCVEGRRLLYEYCRKFSIPHKQIGKIIVASAESERDDLEKIHQQALANGITSLRLVDKTEMTKLEPNVVAKMGLLSPETGIISAHDYCSSLEAQAINAGAIFAYQTVATVIDRRAGGGWKVTTHPVIEHDRLAISSQLAFSALAPMVSIDSESFDLEVDVVINCAGLHSDWVSALAGIDPLRYDYQLTWVKGEYFSLAPVWGKRLSHLIYPLPEKNMRGLGVHVTLDMGGQAKLGPNVVEIESIEDCAVNMSKGFECEFLVTKGRRANYAVDASQRQSFFEAARRYLAPLSIDEISPAYSGIRPKLSKVGEVAKDFIISEETSKGAPGFINLIGIESPGLTSSLAIAQHVSEMI